MARRRLTSRRLRALGSCLGASALLWGVLARPARAAGRDDAELRGSARPHVRVLSETAEIRSGPGFSFRVVAVVERDAVLLMDERGKRGGWTRVRLDSGLVGWVLAEQVLVFSDQPQGKRRFGQRLREKVLGPPSLPSARIGGALSAGALGTEGLFLVRPSVFLSPHAAIEAYLGPSVGREQSRGLFGLGGNLYLSPHLPFTLFVSVGAGGAYSKGKVDTLEKAQWTYLLSPGAGFWIVFKHSVGIRFDFRNHVFFRADAAQSLQEYSGALAFTF